VGFGLKVRDLCDDDSIKLQERGLGGKRRMGCGIFVPFHSTREVNYAWAK
jgi:CRISPR-associated endonuclease/helicase Cas3